MGITLSGSQGLSSPQANGYVILSSLLLLECSSSSSFVAVSILKLTREDLSRNWTLTMSKSSLGDDFPTGRVIATDSVIVATSGYVVPAAYDISPGRVK
ncbi:hypothetical protein Tco_0285159 [Tanacetum coccineum]